MLDDVLPPRRRDAGEVPLPVPRPQAIEVRAGSVELRAVRHDRWPPRRRDLRVRVARQVDSEHPEAVRRAIPQARQGRWLDPHSRVRPLDGLVGRRCDDGLGGSVGPGWLDVHDRQPRPRGGQAPAVPAGDDLVHVVPVRCVAGRPVECGELQEPDVRDVIQHGDPRGALARDRHPSPVQAVPLLGHVVPHLDPDAAHEVVQQQLARAIVGGELLGLLDAATELRGPVASGEREARRAERARRRRGGITVGLAGVLADQVPRVLVQLEPGRVRVDVEHHPLVVAERQRATNPGAARLRREDLAVDHDRRTPRRQHLEVVGRRGERHAHPCGAREGGPRAGRIDAVEHDVDREPETAEQSRRRPEGCDPHVEVVLRPVRPRRRRRVRVGFPAWLLLRLLRALVVPPHGVGVDDHLQLRVRGQVLPHEPVELTRHPQVRFRVVQQHLDRRGPVDDLRLIGRQRRHLPAVAALGVGLVGFRERSDRRERVLQPLPGDLERSTRTVRRVLQETPQRAALVQVGERLQQSAGDGVAGKAGPQGRCGRDRREMQVDRVVAHAARRVGSPGLVGQHRRREGGDRDGRRQHGDPGCGVRFGHHAQRQSSVRVQRGRKGQRAPGQRGHPVRGSREM